MRPIEVFADVRCPFTHVGLRRVVERRAEAGGGAPLRVRAWPLELVNGEPLDADHVAEEVDALRDQVAHDLFAGFDRDRFGRSSLPALALTAAAYERGDEVGEAVALAVRWALFEEGLDVSSPEVLAEIAAHHRLPAPGPAHHERVVADWHEGRDRGVVGSPHFFVGDRSWFCPGLDISHDEAGFHVRPDRDAFAEFLDAAFGD
jgi:predicted DsbA family dithiol-disulfide isomerase